MALSKEEIDIAKQIADLIAKVDTNHRGNVLLEASNQLTRKSQNFTATIFNLAAHPYGIKS